MFQEIYSPFKLFTFPCKGIHKILFYDELKNLIVSLRTKKRLKAKNNEHTRKSQIIGYELQIFRKPLGRKFKKVNKVSIFSFFEVFLLSFLASHNVEK